MARCQEKQKQKSHYILASIFYKKKNILDVCWYLQKGVENDIDSSFYRIWKKHKNEIRIMCRGTDFCATCAKLMVGRDSTSHTRGLKLDVHKVVAEISRLYYINNLKNATDSDLIIMFDYAQAIPLPRFVNQPGDLYYKSGIKLNCFGRFFFSRNI